MKQTHRILLNGEYSVGCSGYGKVTKEVLGRLHNTGKYELAELASDATPEDVENHEHLWKVYPVRPNNNDPQEQAEYQAHPANPSGRHKFNPVCLDFQPSVVLDARDAWYKEYEHISPFRRFYNLIWNCPTDGIPLQNEWIDDIIDCDAAFSYTKWGEKVLRDQCGSKGNVVGDFRLGVNFEHFYPIWPKRNIKELFGFKDDSLVVGFVARNQYRKMFDDLFQSFTYFLIHGPKEITSKTYLYLHTGWPDIGWNFPQLLMEYGIGSKVLFTYFCKNCHNIFPSTYCDTTCICKHCGMPTAQLPRPQDEIPESQLNLIYNFFDVYTQVAVAEGLGIPAIEAMSVSCPTMVIDYSGTEDMVNSCGAIPLKVTRLRREPELNRLWAIPDIEDLAIKITEILCLPDSIRKNIGYQQYQKTLKEFNWDVGVNKLMATIDKMPIRNWKDKNLRFHKPNMSIPNNLNNEQFVRFLYTDIIGRPELLKRHKVDKLIYGLTMGWTGTKPSFSMINREIAAREALGDNEYYNHWEQMRKDKFKL